MTNTIPLFDLRTDHYQGETSADIELIEYGDFLCGYCSRVYPEIKYLQDALSSQFRFVYRHFPSFRKHPLAIEAMLATEAAGKQGKFWYMHDMIFEHQPVLRTSSFRKFANDIGMDICQFENDMQDTIIMNKIKSDVLCCHFSHIKRTPTFYIN